MVPAELPGAFNAFYRQHQFPKPDPSSDENSMAGLDPSAAGLGQGDIAFCQLSPLHPITLDDETRNAAGIPKDARYFAWAYPMVDDGSIAFRGGGTPAKAFLEYGGYIYFSDACDVVGTNAIQPAPPFTLGLMFGRPQLLPAHVADVLTRRGRFQEITLEPLRRAGATHFGWIRPSEFSDCVASPDGCFVYKFAMGQPKYFPVVQRPVFTREMLDEDLEETEAWVVVRNALPTPTIEVPVIFDKTKSLSENAESNTHEVAHEGAADVRIGKDSQPDLSMTYEQWAGTGGDKGTITDPWIICIRRS